MLNIGSLMSISKIQFAVEWGKKREEKIGLKEINWLEKGGKEESAGGIAGPKGTRIGGVKVKALVGACQGRVQTLKLENTTSKEQSYTWGWVQKGEQGGPRSLKYGSFYLYNTVITLSPDVEKVPPVPLRSWMWLENILQQRTSSP